MSARASLARAGRTRGRTGWPRGGGVRASFPRPLPPPLLASSLLISSLLFAAPPARAQHLMAALSSKVIQITSSFTGVSLTLFGTIEGEGAPPPARSYDIVVTVRGPRQSSVTRRKERLLGIWTNAASRTFLNVPSYLMVLSNRPFEDIAAGETLRREQIGIANVVLQQEGGPGNAAAPADDPFRQALVRLKEERNLYGEDTGGVTFLTPRLYRASIYVPAEAVVGNYDVDVKLIADGAVIADTGLAFEIVTVGFPRFIANAAVNQPLAYGLATTVLAVVTGWMASILFRRD